jgi:hypothetical protein
MNARRLSTLACGKTSPELECDFTRDVTVCWVNHTQLAFMDAGVDQSRWRKTFWCWSRARRISSALKSHVVRVAGTEPMR